MSQLTLDRAAPGRTAPDPSPAPLAADAVAYHPRTPVEVALAAARADVVRLSFSAAVPSVAAMARLVADLEQEIAAVGRPRADVLVELEVEVVVVAAGADADRTARRMADLDALAGVPWVPSATRVVAPAPEAERRVRDLGAAVGADVVVPRVLSGVLAAAGADVALRLAAG